MSIPTASVSRRETALRLSEEMMLPLDCRLPVAESAGQARNHEPIHHRTAGGCRGATRRAGSTRTCRAAGGDRCARRLRADQIAVAGEGTGAVMMPQFEFIYDGIASMLAITLA